MNSFIESQENLKITTGNVAIAWTGQAGFAFKDSADFVYHVDPYLSNICSKTVGYDRIIPAPVQAKEVIADFILVTHNHKDHLDDDSIPGIAMANPEATFIGPPSCISQFLDLGVAIDRLETINRGEQKKIGNITIKAVLAYHIDDSVGYVLNIDDISCYITGDTTYSDNLISAVKEENPDVMMPCINGRLGCMNIPDAARLTAHIQPQFAVPMHYGMFRENTADPKEFIRLVEAYSGITKGMELEQAEWYLLNSEQGFSKISD